ncbi:hypothetical protein AMAG_02937 [Allomyces macrogynus ATCC 38327]|uniref:EF-hand domain-containing protein n=1 Tax=Allomyces macrogynus (strain ATCC 38327) TaxID=578462 RepID=A0A0L0S498_ALLM3|nr:hypothetical protein AMAG_02937 [Allomyces macrogynus ATCC 38327]|eukprot:KNE57194.1 hypothetical protein AMAG_02937 [Allomyces macrogynus ATCC 38327]
MTAAKIDLAALAPNRAATATSFLDVHYAVNAMYLPALRAMFDAADADKDGHLSPTELRALCADVPGEAALYDNPTTMTTLYALLGIEPRASDLALPWDAHVRATALQAVLHPDAAWHELQRALYRAERDGSVVVEVLTPLRDLKRGDFPDERDGLPAELVQVRDALDAFLREVAATMDFPVAF